MLVFLCGVAAAVGSDLDVPAEKIGGGSPDGMMHRYLLRQAEQAFTQWKTEYERRKTPEQIAAYQKKARETLLEALGGLPERTPLGAASDGHGRPFRLSRGEGHLPESAETLRHRPAVPAGVGDASNRRIRA